MTWIPFWRPSLSVQEAMVLDIANYLLNTAPVLGPGTRLRDHPGIYPADGVALYAANGEVRLALEYEALCVYIHADMPKAFRDVAHTLTPESLATMWRDHPLYRGRQRGPRFRDARWYAAAVPEPPQPPRRAA